MRFAQADPERAGQAKKLRHVAASPGHRQVKVITGQGPGTDDIPGEVCPLTLGLTVLLYLAVPKGFFPVQDTGVIQGISEAPPAKARRSASTTERSGLAPVGTTSARTC